VGSGWITGAGEPAAFQIGITAAPALELALHRHEKRRWLMPGEAGFAGFVEEARALADGAVLYRVVAPEDEVPRARVRFEADAVEVLLEDPARAFGREAAVIEVRGEQRTVRIGEPGRWAGRVGCGHTGCGRWHVPSVPEDGLWTLAFAVGVGNIACECWRLPWL